MTRPHRERTRVVDPLALDARAERLWQTFHSRLEACGSGSDGRHGPTSVTAHGPFGPFVAFNAPDGVLFTLDPIQMDELCADWVRFRNRERALRMRAIAGG